MKAITSIVILFMLASTLSIVPISPTAAVVFPGCARPTDLQIYPTYQSGDPGNPSNTWGIAGCTYPFGDTVQVWFTDGANASIPGFVSQSSPMTLTSRTTDGHFHEMFNFPSTINQYINSFAANSVAPLYLHASDPSTGAARLYQFEWIGRYCGVGNVCNSSVGCNGPCVYPNYTPAGPAGSLGIFLDAITSSGDVGVAHVSVYFYNSVVCPFGASGDFACISQSNATVPGLPSYASPFNITTFPGGQAQTSFILQDDSSLDLTQFNVEDAMYIRDCSGCADIGRTIFFPIWFHKPVPPTWTNGVITSHHHLGVKGTYLNYSGASDSPGSGVASYNIYNNGTLLLNTPNSLNVQVSNIPCSGQRQTLHVEARDLANNTSNTGPSLDITMPLIQPQTGIYPDVNQDCIVNSTDTNLVTPLIGARCGNSNYITLYDVNRDCVINNADLNLISHYLGNQA